MPQISLRACEMPESPIRKLFPLAEAAKARGVKVYHLNIGQPDLPTPQVGLDALKQVDRTVLEYSPSDGYRSLREKLVEYYAQYQIRLTADDIIVTTGGSEAVLFAFMSCLNPGDEIIVPEPAYANYMAFAVSAGAVIRPITASIEDGFALPSVEKFEELINDRTRGILICNPNNPTGYLYTRREMMQIRDLVKRYDLFLFSDEVYREFIYTGSPYISACHLEGIEQNVVLIDSVSKRYSMCGVRLGTLVSRNRRIIDAALKMGQARLCPPYLAQVAAEAALGAPRSYFEEVHDEYAARRNCIIEALNKIEGVEWVLDPVTMQSLVGALVGLPNGVLAMSHAVEGLVETSSNLASVKFGAEGIVVTTSQRSSVESAKRYAAQTVEAVLRLSGAEVAHSDGYPGWSPDPDSYLLHVTEQCYERLFAVKPKVRAIHAGLECGLFLEKYPELDMVSFGPTLRGVHSPDERLEIATVQKFWDLLCAVVGSL